MNKKKNKMQHFQLNVAKCTIIRRKTAHKARVQTRALCAGATC